MLALVVCSYSLAFAQSNVQAITDAYTTYRSQNLDVAYLHMNKKAFDVGESLYFSAYVHFEGASLEDSPYRNLQVSLYDATGKWVQGSVFPLRSIGTSGSLNLEVPVGTYFVKTQLQGSAAQGAVYPISIQENLLFSHEDRSDAQVGVDWACEGGACYEGVSNKIVFRLKESPEGSPVVHKAAILNESQGTSIDIAIIDGVMGLGQFTPDGDSEYVLYAALSNKTALRTPIQIAPPPEIRVSMATVNDALLLSFEKPVMSNDMSTPYYVAFPSGERLEVIALDINKPQQLLKISMKTLNSGIHRITVFNAARVPVLQRVIYKPEALKSVTPSLFKAVIRGKEKDAVQIMLTSAGSTYDMLNVSASIFPETARTVPAVDVARASIYGGFVQPAHIDKMPKVIKSKRDQVKLDVLLMLYGEQLEWPSKSNNEKSPRVFQGFRLEGRVKNVDVTATNELLFYQQSVGHFFTTPLNEDGTFQFEAPLIYKGEKINFSVTRNGKPFNKPKIDFNVLPAIMKDSLPARLIASFTKKTRTTVSSVPAERDELPVTSKDIVQLDNIELKGKKKAQDLNRNDQLNQAVYESIKIDEDIIRKNVMLANYLRRLGFRIVLDALRGQFFVRSNRPHTPSPTLFLDGFQVGALSNIPLTSIDEVYYEKIGAIGNPGGSIYIYQKIAGTVGADRETVVALDVAHGYAKELPYAQLTTVTTYTKKQAVYGHLHWAQTLSFDQNGEAFITVPHFGQEAFKIELQGADASGKLFSESLIISTE